MKDNASHERAFKAYLKRSSQPLHCIVFLLPFLAFYEISLALLHFKDINAADAMMRVALNWAGISAYYAPAICIIVIFLIWQVAGRYSWKIDGWTIGGMLIESAVFTIPLIILHNLFAQMDIRAMSPPPSIASSAGPQWLLQLTAGGLPDAPDWFRELVLSIGAGIYEELVFRLALVAGLAFLIERVARFTRQSSLLIAVLISAAIFSAFHYWGAGGESFQWPSFLFRTSAAIYLSVLFASRGLGIAAGAHMLFNCALTLLRPY